MIKKLFSISFLFWTILFFFPTHTLASTFSTELYIWKNTGEPLCKERSDSETFHRELSLGYDSTATPILFQSHTPDILNVSFKTDVFVNNATESSLSIPDHFFDAKAYPLNKDGEKVLFVQTSAGQLTHTLLYTYREEIFTRIPIIVDYIGSDGGTLSSFSGMEDTDNDGAFELMIYHRHIPPERARTVDVFKFNEGSFEKVREYEEQTAEIYY